MKFDTPYSITIFRLILKYFTSPRVVTIIPVVFILVLFNGCSGARNNQAGSESSMLAGESEVRFSVRAPKNVPLERRMKEIFPLGNRVFFEDASTEIPIRYELLTKEQANTFKEEQLQEVQSKNSTGRSLRQMTVYYNILNIVGDRMRRNSSAVISLIGASPGRGAEQGKKRAEAVKRYLVEIFGIDGVRITTEGRDKPKIPSESQEGTKEHDLLVEGDARVDIESTSSEMMTQVGEGTQYILKPVQIKAVVENPLDSYVIFIARGSKKLLTSWSVEMTDDQGKVFRVGPFTQEQINISGNKILENRAQADYKVIMTGLTKNGTTIRKETTVHLNHANDSLHEALRFSVLFDFDRSKTVAPYEKFLSNVVTPLIPDYSVVVIHGHTDIIGDEEYNDNLSRERALDTRSIIERATWKLGKRGITFETFGFGENPEYTPFDNYFPEQRFYNRTVIIDIVPE